MNMKSSLFTFPKKQQSYKEIIDYAKKIGFNAVELYRALEFEPPDVDAGKRIGEYAKKRNMEISCLSVGANLSKLDNSQEIKRLKKYVDVAKAVGSPYLHHTLVPVLNHNFKAVSFGSILKRLVKAESEICDYAKMRGIMILNENQGFCMNGIEPFNQFLSELDHENYGLVGDMGNILFVGEKPEKFIGKFAPYIKHMHVKDYLYKPGAGLYPGDEWYITRDGDFIYDTAIGYGVINFKKVFRILISSGYKGYYSIECSGLEATLDRLKISFDNMNSYYNSVSSFK